MDNLNNIPNAGNWGDAASKLNDNFNKIKQSLTTVENTSKNNKGYFTSLSALNTALPNPKAGQTAYVYDEASSTKYYIYNAVNGAWVATSIEAPSVGVDLAEYTKTGGSPKTLKEVDDTKANHGYDSSPKTLKEVEDDTSVKMTNLLQTSSFENGVTGIVTKNDSGGVASTLSINAINPISGNYDARLEVTTPGTYTDRPMLYLNGSQNRWVLNHVFYFGMSVKVNSGTPILRSAYNGNGTNILNLTLKDGFNSWTVECLGLSNFAVIYLDGRTLWDFNFDNLIAYDLTAIFGAGNEPTKEEMDLIISTLGIDYFEGEITIPAQKIMQWLTIQMGKITQLSDEITQLADYQEIYNASWINRKLVRYNSIEEVLTSIPNNIRKSNLLVSFCTPDYEPHLIQHVIGSYNLPEYFENPDNWVELNSPNQGNIFYLDYIDSPSSTRLQVPSRNRKRGTILSYEIDGERIIELNTSGTSGFSEDENWVSLLGNPKAVEYIPKWEYGWIGNDGKEYAYGINFLRHYRTPLYINVKNSRAWEFSFASDHEIKIYYIYYNDEFTPISGRIQVFENIKYNISEDVAYMRLVMSKETTPGDFNETLFNFRINFYSEDIDIEEVKHPKLEDYTEVHYTFKRNLGGDVLSETEDNPVKYSDKLVTGNGYIMLPNSYKPTGKPTRLIIFAHGSANTQPSLGDYEPYVKYLVAQGYAVADCHAWGKLDENYIGTQFWGSPTNYAAYQAFYTFLMQRYNLYSDIFLFGKSQGGCQVFGIPYCTSIPVKAACSLAGESSAIGNQHGYTTEDRFACYEDMGFSGLEKDAEGNYIGEGSIMIKEDSGDYRWPPERIEYYRKNKSKWAKYNPYMASVIDLNKHFDNMFPYLRGANGNFGDYDNDHPVMQVAKVPRCPFICFVARDDMYAAANRMKRQIENGGGICVMRLMPSGNESPHHAVDTTAPTVSGIPTLSGDIFDNVPISYVEMLEFFKLYE